MAWNMNAKWIHECLRNLRDLGPQSLFEQCSPESCGGHETLFIRTCATEACTEAKNAVNAAGVWDDEDFMPTMFSVDFQAPYTKGSPKAHCACRQVCIFSSDPVKAVDLIKKQQLEEPAQLRLEFIGNYMRHGYQRRSTNSLGVSLDKIDTRVFINGYFLLGKPIKMYEYVYWNVILPPMVVCVDQRG